MLRILAFPFWNAEERRLRAFFRLVLGTMIPFLIQPYVFLGLWRRAVPSPAPAWIGDVKAIVDTNLTHAADHNVEAMFGEASTAMITTLVVLSAMWLAARFLDRRSFDDLGLYVDGGFWIDAGFGYALGALLMVAILVAEQALGLAVYRERPEVGDVPSVVYAGVTFFTFVSVAINEEIVSRGYHMTNLAEGFRCRWIGPTVATAIAIAISSSIFGLAHLGNPNATLVSSGNIVLAGVWLAIGYALTGRIAIPLGIHLSWNFFQNLFGMPVSGTDRYFLGALVQRDEVGPDWITGGAFGPEAGMTGLFAMAAGTFLTLAWVRVRRGSLRVDPRIAEYRRG